MGYKWTEVGVIPEDWDVASLGEMAKIATGGTPPTHDSTYYGDEYPFVSPVDLGEAKYVTHTEKGLSKKGFAISRRFPAESILFVSIGSTIGKCGVASVELTSNQQINAILPSPSFSVDYLYYTICSAAPRIKALAGEQAVPIVNKTQLSETLIVLAPKPEQRAIAEALSDVDELLAALEALIAKKRAVKQAAMQQLLTGKSRLPGFSGAWETMRLGDLGAFSKGRGIKRDDVSDTGLPCIRYGELYTRYKDYILNPVSRIPSAVALEALPIKKGDLLFAGSGETAEEIGICAAYLGEEPAYAGGDVIILTPSGQNSIYLGHLMNHPIVATQKARMGQGDAVVHISASNLAQVSIELPPLTEQTAIANILSDMDTEIAALERRRDKTRVVKQGMMQQLLTGRVRLTNNSKNE